MTAVVLENIRILLLQYTFETDGDFIGEDLICTICCKLMIDACQTSCGCKYCYECMVRFLNEGNNYCRGGKEECQEDRLVLDDNVYRSAHLNKRIMKVRVHCPNRPCVFICPLAEMGDHLRVCGQQPLECPYVTIGCGCEGVYKDRIETHLNNEALAHSRLLIEAINNLRNELGGVREGLRMSHLEMASVREELIKKVECVEEKMREGLSRIAVLEDAVATKGRGESCTMESEAAAVDNRGGREVLPAETNRSVQEQGEERAASAVRRERSTVGTLNGETDTVGRLYFTADRWAERIVEAEVVWSPYVYSHTNGYKLRLKVHPGGDGCGAGTHVSVSSVLCRGEYDAVLPWPCSHAVTMTVVNQHTKEAHTSETIVCCTINNDRFKRPIDTDNPPCGWPSLVSHADLQSTEGLVVNDSIILLIVVAPSPVVVVSFIVDRFSERRTVNDTVYSPYFYSHTNGYKLRLEVDPGGWNDGRGTHVSVYGSVCKGENDETLVWPCRYGIAMSLINHRTNEAYVTEINTPCSIYQSYFNKPIDTENEGLGYDTFVSHTDLDSIDGLVVNDSVIFRVAVIAPQ